MQGFIVFLGGDNVNDIEEKLKTLPDKSGVYIMKNFDGDIIYVGKAKILKNRVRQYFKSHNHSLKVQKMIDSIADFEYIITDNENEALILENNLIKENKPKYNILLKDDKTYPFIKITMNEDFPRVFITRRVIRDGAKYFGPYCSTVSLKELISLINDVFSLRQCKKLIIENEKKERTCLYHQLGKCSAPCNGSISKEEYRNKINDVISFLNGKYEHALSITNKKMKDAANELDFESAAKWRNAIESISVISEKQKIVSHEASDCDAIAMYCDNGSACIEIFFIRSGKIIGKEHYFISFDEDVSEAFALSEFIKQYYDTATFLPHQLLTQFDLFNKEEIEKFLTDKANHSVKITVPKIGDKYKLINMIASNAKKEHHERELKIMRDISFKNNALSDLQKITKANLVPMHIEAYDISNLSGKYMVGSMVTFINGKPCKNKYRSFKIKYVSGQDDYACMSEIISRRIVHGFKEKDLQTKEKQFYPFPDMILVDGGIGHVQTVEDVLSDYGLDIPVFGIAKNDKHKTNALVSSKEELLLDKTSEVFMLLCQIQDEMHRRAITHQRKLHEKSTLKTELLSIKGVGDKKALILLRHFKSIKHIKEASLEEISSVPGIDIECAKNIFSFFSEN